MGKVIIQNYTCKNPITMIGFEAGICWGADTGDEKKNYRRGLDCLESGHGRTFEFPDVYLTLEGYLTFSCIPRPMSLFCVSAILFQPSRSLILHRSAACPAGFFPGIFLRSECHINICYPESYHPG